MFLLLIFCCAYRDKWVNYYEVSKSNTGANAYNPSNTTYLWYYNAIDAGNSSNNCNKVLISNLLMTIYKNSSRYTSELENGRTLVEVGKDITTTTGGISAGIGAGGSVNNNAVVSGDIVSSKDTVELLQLRLNRLQRSILSVAETLLLMQLSA